jgi:hypothetical protein
MARLIAELARRYPGITFEFDYSTSRGGGSIWWPSRSMRRSLVTRGIFHPGPFD